VSPSLLNGKTALIKVKISCNMILQLWNRCYWHTSRAARERIDKAAKTLQVI